MVVAVFNSLVNPTWYVENCIELVLYFRQLQSLVLRPVISKFHVR